MHCDVCNTQEATVFLTQIVEGEMKKVNLCESCSKEKGVSDPTGFALADLLLGLGAAQEMQKSGGMEKCPVCGFSQSDFKKTGRLGCATCYETFAEGLESVLDQMHKDTKHIGKVPERLSATLHLDEQMKQLQGDLRDSIGQEDYESAARLRDQIRALEDKINA